MRLGTIFKLGFSAVLVLLGWLLIRPLNLKKLSATSNPVKDYATALARIEALRASDTVAVNALCRTHLLTHGYKVDHVIVFWHGYTNCPHQFCQLGEKFYDLGYNVLIPRLAHHGLLDRMSPAQSQLTAESLTVFVDEVVDIAHGLGHHVTVAGLSAGGVVAGWIAQFRADVDQAVLISPVFGLKAVRPALTGLLTRLLLTLPNHYRWWDRRLKADASIPKHAYPRFSSRGLAHILRLGLAVQAAARHDEPAVPSIQVITNPHDWAVNNKRTAQLVNDWRSHGAGIETYAFDPALELGHDLIDPEHATPQVEVVYPILVDLITKAGRKETGRRW